MKNKKAKNSILINVKSIKFRIQTHARNFIFGHDCAGRSQRMIRTRKTHVTNKQTNKQTNE